MAALSAVHVAVRQFARPDGLVAPEVLSPQQRGSIIRRAVDGAQRSVAAFTRAALLWEIHRTMPAMAAGVDQVALAESWPRRPWTRVRSWLSARPRTWWTYPHWASAAVSGSDSEDRTPWPMALSV